MTKVHVMIGMRLREERERLGFNQQDFAALGGASKRSQIEWEKENAYPNAAFLAAIAAGGADVQYILTGVRAHAMAQTQHQGEPLTPREAALLDNYRHSSAAARDALDKTSAAFAQPAAHVKEG